MFTALLSSRYVIRPQLLSNKSVPFPPPFPTYHPRVPVCRSNRGCKKKVGTAHRYGLGIARPLTAGTRAYGGRCWVLTSSG
jgi:hypothetical protein